MTYEFIFSIAILIMSAVIHEVAHGVAANSLGDPTAKYQGRLTLNPIKHMDMMGSFIVPLLSYQLGGFIFGWAKPVPYNPHNLKPGKFSEAIVAGAGPLSNFLIAALFSILIRFSANQSYATPAFIHITALIVFVNILLGIFNLMPIPPLDGSKLLFSVFPDNAYKMRQTLERYGFVLVLVFIFFLWQLISPIINIIFSFLTGLPPGASF
jgi:Zn-dependent protease